MKPSRDLAAGLLVRSGLVRMASRLHARLRPDIRVLAYHRVLPKLDEASFPYDIELVSAWQEEFDWQVSYLARNHQVITCHDLAALLDAGRPVPSHAVIITFDDGYRDNHDIVLPVLRKHGVPAVIFVATGYIDGHETFWYDRVVHDVLHARAADVSFDPARPPIALGHDAAKRRAAAHTIVGYLKRLPDAQRMAAIERLREDLSAAQTADRSLGMDGPMSWGQVKALSDAGVEIGSHSVNHPVLANVGDPKQLKHELTASKAAIEAQVGKPVISLAYPVGGPSAYDEHVVAATKEAGYRFAFTYVAGSNVPHHVDPFRMRRLAVERYVSRDRFSAMLAMPPLFAYSWSG